MYTCAGEVAARLAAGRGLEASMVDWRSDFEGMVVVVADMEAKTAAAMGSRGGLAPGVAEEEGVVVVVMAFSVRARMAFWDFLVPKARPREVRAERRWRGGG